MKTIPITRPQLETLSNTTRLRIHSSLSTDGPATAKALAARLDVDELKLYYHLRLLERQGLIASNLRPGTTKPQGVYSIVGRFLIEGLDLEAPDNRQAVCRNVDTLLRSASQEHRQAADLLRNGLYSSSLISRSAVSVSKESLAELHAKLEDLLSWLHDVAQPGTNPVSLTILALPLAGPKVKRTKSNVEAGAKRPKRNSASHKSKKPRTNLY